MRVTRRVHSELASNRRQDRQARQTPIYRVTKSGAPAKRPTVFADPERVAEQIAYLERVNPGSTFVAG